MRYEASLVSEDAAGPDEYSRCAEPVCERPCANGTKASEKRCSYGNRAFEQIRYSYQAVPNKSSARPSHCPALGRTGWKGPLLEFKMTGSDVQMQVAIPDSSVEHARKADKLTTWVRVTILCGYRVRD